MAAQAIVTLGYDIDLTFEKRKSIAGGTQVLIPIVPLAARVCTGGISVGHRRFTCEEPSTQGLSHEAECQPDVCTDKSINPGKSAAFTALN